MVCPLADPALSDTPLGGNEFPEGFGPSTRGDDCCTFSDEAAQLFFFKTGCTHVSCLSEKTDRFRVEKIEFLFNMEKHQVVRAHQPPTVGAHFSKSARVITVRNTKNPSFQSEF